MESAKRRSASIKLAEWKAALNSVRFPRIGRQQQLPFAPVTADAPLCAECGSIMTRNGRCYKCGNCGGTSGCS